LLMLETIGTGEGFQRDLLSAPIAWEGGYVVVPDGPGLGVELNEALAREHPYEGDRLHLEMHSQLLDYRGDNRFAGG
jgi:hypothetical protein